MRKGPDSVYDKWNISVVNDLQNKTTQTTIGWATWTPLIMNLDAEEQYSSYFTRGIRRITVKRHKNHLRWKSCLLYPTILLAKYIFSHQCLNSIVFNSNLVVSSPKTDTKYKYYNSYSCKCMIYIFILQWKALLVGLNGRMYWRMFVDTTHNVNDTCSTHKINVFV